MMRLGLPAMICSIISIAPAVSAAPKIDASCNGFPVLTARYVAAQYAGMARDRMNSLAKLGKADRKSAWKAGPEAKWLGAYTDARFDVARSIVTKTAAILNDNYLTISCDKTFSEWGKISGGKYVNGPEYYDIVLGKPWLYGMLGLAPGRLDGERQVTLVHEAAHKAGANRGELLHRSYAKWALQRAERHPGIAARTPENHGYYAICRASTSSACTPQ
jgi:hypothetical protein